MTDRIFALTVVLEDDVRDDDVTAITDAIEMIRGVLSVKRHVADIGQHAANERARRELYVKVLDMLVPPE